MLQVQLNFLSGATIFSSSNSGNVVDFSAGTKDVFCTMPASKSVFLDATGTPVGAASAVLHLQWRWRYKGINYGTRF